MNPGVVSNLYVEFNDAIMLSYIQISVKTINTVNNQGIQWGGVGNVAYLFS
jgi:hypothetical protein